MKIFYSLAAVLILSSNSNYHPVPRYISIAFIQSTSPDFIDHEKTFWLPVQKELIKAGRKDAWYMFKVKPADSKAIPYDYVRFNVFHDKAQAVNPYAGLQQFIDSAYPGQDMSEPLKKTNTTRVVVWEQLYEIIGKPQAWVLNPGSSLSFFFNVPSPGSNRSVQLQAIEPLKKENLYPFIGLYRYEKKKLKNPVFELAVSAMAN